MRRQSLTQLQKAMHLSYVPRWGIVAMDRDQSVAEHSYRVAMIALRLGSETDRAIDLAEVLAHDLEESHTGDTPYTEKDDGAEKLKTLNEFECILRLADCLEAYTWFLLHGHALQRDFILVHSKGRIRNVLSQCPRGWVHIINRLIQEIVPRGHVDHLF